MKSRTWGLAFGSLLFVGPNTALGQTSDSAAAQILFNEGRKLVSERRFEQACPKFEESLRLDSGIGTRLNLADCWEHTGRTASAWSLFLEVAMSARSAGQKDREKLARKRAQELEPRLSRLLIRVKTPDNEVEVLRNGSVVGRPQWDLPVPVDPGTYVIEARAAHKQLWKTTIEIGPSAAVSIVVVPDLEDDGAKIGATTTAPRVDASPTPSVSPPADTTAEAAHVAGPAGRVDVASPSRTSSNVAPTVGWIMVGTGVAGIALGAVFENLSRSSARLADDFCASGPAGTECRDQAELEAYFSARNRAKNRGFVAYSGLIGGGALLVTGAILVLTSGSSDGRSARPARATFAVPMIGSDAYGIAFQGAW
ncbi:MAG TPA: hypothetical protein VK540_28840 [Polyangiaceae bacterium]|nr:hypothetical protein [Polyangiaceae bacterium]